jgi:hypothetical protein
MAYLATLQLLIDAESESAATVMSSDIAGQLQADGQVLDWSVSDARAVNETIRDSIVNETYVSGECFGEYIVVSTTKRPQDASFWSNTYGWTSYDLATRFDATVADLPKAVLHDSAAFFLDRGAAAMLGLVTKDGNTL